MCKDVEKWSRDWGHFDWESVLEKVIIIERELGTGEEVKGLYDIGITKEQFKEYFLWLYENDPKKYEKLMLYIILREKGMQMQDAEFCSSHPKEFKKALKIVHEKDNIN